MLTYETWSDDFIAGLEFKDSLDCLKWTFDHYGDEVVYACSFGAESIVLLDLISKVKANSTVVFIDTDMHFQETYELIEQIKRKYPGLQIKFVKTALTIEEQGKQYGEELWKTNPDRCCYLRKIEPLQKELVKYKAWLSGLRREQSRSRANVQYLNQDHKFKLIKICPLIHWTWDEIWMYMKLHQLPYNPLHDKGYPSIGCEVCTMPVVGNQNLRSGRWQNHQKTECGLHQF